MSGQKVIVITGPTAAGKSTLGIRLAELIDGEIVSADSMQVYKRMDIGTAKPTADEKRGVRHHMIDIVPPNEAYSAARYVREASECVDNIFRRGKLPILVGGTGLYIDSLLAGRAFSARGNPELRKALESKYDDVGGESMLSKLSEVDKDSAEKLHVNDKKRIVRALEVYKTIGKPVSLHDFETKAVKPRYDAVKIALNYADRDMLYAKINHRVDNMISNGLKREVEALLKMGVSRDCTSMQAIGYKEISDALIGIYEMNDAVEKVKMESRRYAKRQLTWLRRDNEIRWITWDKEPDISRAVDEIIETERSLRQRHEKK